MVLAAVTMVLGNLIAIAQSNIKRLLAYSSIGHAGYLLMGIAALAAVGSNGELALDRSHLVTNAIMLHLVAYGVTNMAVFLVVSTVCTGSGDESISSFSGLSRRSPGTAMVMAAALFSLAGLPIFAGFTSKFYLFTATASQGFLWLAGLAILMSLVSLYYYLMVIRQMYIESGDESAAVAVPRLTFGILAVLFVGMALVGVYPALVMEFIQNASEALFTTEFALSLQ